MERSGPGELKDNHRVVLVFAPSPKDERYKRQVEAFEAGTEDLVRRDVVRMVFFDAVGGDGAPDAGTGLRRRYGVPSGRFCVMLIGRDGEEKLRREEPVSAGELVRLIDAMPMGSREAE